MYVHIFCMCIIWILWYLPGLSEPALRFPPCVVLRRNREARKYAPVHAEKWPALVLLTRMLSVEQNASGHRKLALSQHLLDKSSR